MKQALYRNTPTYANAFRVGLGPTPTMEPATPSTPGNDTLTLLLREADVFRQMMERTLPVPEGLPVTYVVRLDQHELGAYADVEAEANGDCPEAVQFALAAEAQCPEQWDEIARQQITALAAEPAEAA